MLDDRGYVIPRELEAQQYDSFRDELKDKQSSEVRRLMQISVGKKDDPRAKMNVFFCEGKARTDVVKHYKTQMEQQDVVRAVIVMNDVMTPHGRSTIEQINLEGKLHFQTFLEAQLLVNITEHNLVPKHLVLSAGDVDELVKRYNLKKSQLPRMELKDPISQYYGLVRGDVVKIIRKSETAGRYVTYRTVV